MFKFKKIASVLASAVMLSSTIGFAAAASYPAPFVVGGTADGAVVYGVNAALSDVTAAIDVQQKLGALVTSGTSGTSSGSVSGEAAELFTPGGTRLYINDSLNTLKSVLVKSDLPTVLSSNSFSGNVDASITQTIEVGGNPRITFEKQPTSSEDPSLALKTTTDPNTQIYNLSASFSKAVNFTHASSEGQDISLFGQKFTVSAATDGTQLVLLKSAEKVSLSSDSPTADVVIDGSTYTVELISASDTAATIRVTDSAGKTETQEINEAASKKVNGITVAVTNADETNLKLSATVVAGSNKITLKDGTTIKSGESDTTIRGTKAYLTGGTNAMTKLVVSIAASTANEDAIKPGVSFTDPVFESLKLDFAGLNIPIDDTGAREKIAIETAGDDRMEITFTDSRDITKTFQFLQNTSNTDGMKLRQDNNGHNITVFEKQNLKINEYAVVGNEREGRIVELTSVSNDSDTYTGNVVEFTDVISGDSYKTTFTNESSGTTTIGGKSYTVYLSESSSTDENAFNVTLDYQDSSGAGVAVIYPTVQTSKGAKIAFYQPLTINATSWNGDFGTDITQLRFPDGDGYTNVAIQFTYDNISIGGTNISQTTSGTNGTSVSIGQLVYTFNMTGAGRDSFTVRLRDVAGTEIHNPALVIFEEKDDESNYEALIVTFENSSDGIGVNDVQGTWEDERSGSNSWRVALDSNSKITRGIDLFGTVYDIDTSSSGKNVAEISYPDNQVHAEIYMAEVAASITPGTTTGGGGGQVMIVKDSEITSVSTKNLVVVGGSCINAVAAKILGSETPLCAEDFTEKTGTGVGQYIIKSVVSPYNENKVALLVAGYEAADTVNAVKKAAEGVTTDAGTEQVYPIASA